MDLTTIIRKYKPEIHRIGGNREDIIFKNFFSKVNKNIISDWLDSLFVAKTLKNQETSGKFRDEGNLLFKEKNYSTALKLYTESINHAPQNCDEFSLAFANRSAVLYIIGDYTSCIKDAETCLRTNYPLSLKYKIYLRLINCYKKLHMFKKLGEILKIFRVYLEDNQHGLEQQKIDELFQEINSVENDETCKDKIGETSSDVMEKISEKLPKLKGGNNDHFLCSSKAVDLVYSKSDGRHVIAVENLKAGDVLFVEKSFSYVPILKLEHNNESDPQKCYHCFAATENSFPCRNCTLPFCDQKCEMESWEKYHRWECLGSCAEIWTRVGVVFLAFRILLLGASTGYKNVFSQPENQTSPFGDSKNNYPYICSLVTNVEKMEDNEEIFPHVVSSLVFTLYLKEKTDFFSWLKAQNFDHLPQQITDDDLALILGGVLLKHILQVIANATTIEAVHKEFFDKFNSGEQVTKSGIHAEGVGLYSSVCMMNHSCEPNISNYFCDDYIIVKANKEIPKGSQIFSNYGTDCRNVSTEDRKTNLMKQHHFICKCPACCVPTKPEIFHDSLACQKCKGCSINTHEEMYKCISCEHEFCGQNHFLYIVKAEELMERYEQFGRIDHLQKCVALREKVYYKYNFEIYTALLDLQIYYGDTGNFNSWWKFTQQTLEMEEHMFGKTSLQYARNLRFAVLIIMAFISNLDKEEKNKISEKRLEALVSEVGIIIQKMQDIFFLYYPEDKISFNKIREMQENVIERSSYIIQNKLYVDSSEEFET